MAESIIKRNVDPNIIFVMFNVQTGTFGEFSTSYSLNEYICIGAFQSYGANYEVGIYQGANGMIYGHVFSFNGPTNYLANTTVPIRLLLYKWA